MKDGDILKIYLDDSALHRLLDDRRLPEVKYERELMVMIVELIEKEAIDCVGSEVLNKQIKATENVFKETILEVLYSMTKDEVKVNRDILERAEEIRRKFGDVLYTDSLHIACAEVGEADVFVTVDEKLVKASKGIKLKTRLMTLPRFLMEVLK
ncbi:MAG: PIN domain-containing protein [Lachnospiraceae bacterium]|nr:PIN domain-containing protein [Lachnospiraceae bacterium]